jgi:hypothetical protein
MRPVWVFIAVTLALGAGANGARAFQTPDSLHYPSENETALKLADKQTTQPYAMNYTDEAAQSLGVKDGRWEAFDTHSRDPMLPSLKGGVADGAAMVKLQWHPGE